MTSARAQKLKTKAVFTSQDQMVPLISNKNRLFVPQPAVLSLSRFDRYWILEEP